MSAIFVDDSQLPSLSSQPALDFDKLQESFEYLLSHYSNYYKKERYNVLVKLAEKLRTFSNGRLCKYELLEILERTSKLSSKEIFSLLS